MFACLFVCLFIYLFVFCFNHFSTTTESFPENFMKIRLDLAEILKGTYHKLFLWKIWIHIVIIMKVYYMFHMKSFFSMS